MKPFRWLAERSFTRELDGRYRFYPRGQRFSGVLLDAPEMERARDGIARYYLWAVLLPFLFMVGYDVLIVVAFLASHAFFPDQAAKVREFILAISKGKALPIIMFGLFATWFWKYRKFVWSFTPESE